MNVDNNPQVILALPILYCQQKPDNFVLFYRWRYLDIIAFSHSGDWKLGLPELLPHCMLSPPVWHSEAAMRLLAPNTHSNHQTVEVTGSLPIGGPRYLCCFLVVSICKVLCQCIWKEIFVNPYVYYNSFKFISIFMALKLFHGSESFIYHKSYQRCWPPQRWIHWS